MTRHQNVSIHAPLERHKSCVALYLKESKAGMELRCWDRTHGGRHILLIKIPKLGKP